MDACRVQGEVVYGTCEGVGIQEGAGGPGVGVEWDLHKRK